MKKQLIGTTALVSAGILAGTGVHQGAQAAAPVELSVGGYLYVNLEYRDEDDASGEPGANLQDFAVRDDGEIQFTASTTLDNGIKVRARIEYEATNQGGTDTGGTGSPAGTVSDERWIEFGGVFGQLRLGSDDDAAYSMQYQAPVGAYQIGVNTTTFAVPTVGGNLLSSYPTTYIATNSDAEKIIWFSPRIAGFQLGLSYAPDDSTNDKSSETFFFPALPNSDNEVNQEEDTISIGLNFVDTFGDVDVALAGGYNTSDMEATTVNSDDREQWSAGAVFGFAGFSVGASAAWDNRGRQNRDQFTWDAGATYSTGPLTVGFTWLSAEVEDTLGDDELDSFLISGTYNLGPGVDIFGGLKYFDYEDDADAPGNENEGWIVSLGTAVFF